MTREPQPDEGTPPGIERLFALLESVVVGQRALLRALVTGLLSGGHILVEGLPGLAKTLSVRALARAFGGRFQRVQFTPDLLPADLLGTLVYTPRGGFELRRGPVFCNVLLADEINRAPAKVQSALLEAMEEGAVTIGERTLTLPDPFIVLATQNPIEHEGTYPLPEAQVDRFLFKIVIEQPNAEEERRILDLALARAQPLPQIEPVLAVEELRALRAQVAQVHVDAAIRDYVVRLVLATRDPAAFGLDLAPLIAYGASPRATIGMARAARARALLAGRTFVLPEDVKAVAPWVLGHRVLPSFEAEAEGLDGNDLVARVIERIPLP